MKYNVSKGQHMKYLLIFLTMISLSASSYAVGGMGSLKTLKTVKDKKGGAAVVEKQSGESTKSDKPKERQTTADDLYFSDYPKSFVVPKGVCETKEPVMVIGK